MAFRRFRQRRFGRRKGYRPTRRKAGFRSRKPRRRTTRMSAKRVRFITARKKFDTRVGSVDAATAPTSLKYVAGSTYILSCPTHLDSQVTGDTRYERAQQEIFFRGVKERIFISAKLHVTWRRVVFFSHDRFVVGMPIGGGR